jgi:hypothetical protein
VQRFELRSSPLLFVGNGRATENARFATATPNKLFRTRKVVIIPQSFIFVGLSVAGSTRYVRRILVPPWEFGLDVSTTNGRLDLTHLCTGINRFEIDSTLWHMN